MLGHGGSGSGSSPLEIEDGACVCDGVKNVCMLWLFPLGPEEALPIGAPITLVLERREDRTTTVTVGVIAVLSPRVYRGMHKYNKKCMYVRA